MGRNEGALVAAAAMNEEDASSQGKIVIDLRVPDHEKVKILSTPQMEIFLYPISLNLFDYLSRRFKWDCAVRAGENRRYGQFYGLLYYDCEYLRVYVFLFEFRTVALQHYSPGRSVRRHQMDETTPLGPRMLCLPVVWLVSGGDRDRNLRRWFSDF